MSDDVEALRARIAALEAENARLRGDEPTRVAGKHVLAAFFGMLVLAFGVALGLWTMAKRATRARAEAEARHVPTPSRVDAAGRAVAHAIAECLASARPPVTARVRVKMTPDGNVALLDAEESPPSDEEMICLRQVASKVHVVAGDAAPADVVVTYAITIEPDGTRVTRTKWESPRPAAP